MKQFNDANIVVDVDCDKSVASEENVERIEFCRDESKINAFANILLDREPREKQDVDYFNGECNVVWLCETTMMRITTPSSALMVNDKTFVVPDDKILLYIASNHAVHVGALVDAEDAHPKLTQVRQYINVHCPSIHFTEPLRFDGSVPSKTKSPKIFTIGTYLVWVGYCRF